MVTKYIKDLLATIDGSINQFIEGLSPIQEQNYKKVLSLVKQLDLKGETIKVNVKNLKILSEIKTELDSTIVSKPYIRQVADFTKAFDAVQTLNNDYFASINVGFSPKSVFEEIKKINIDNTIELLTENGIGSAYTSTIKEILTTNITSGGSYASMIETLRDAIIGSEGEDGTLVKYARQIATDSINQYNANYNTTVANDLGLVWFQYTGSLLATSREFCRQMVEKRYFHISEVDELLKGHINGKSIPINAKSGLPYGMIAGTNKKTFFTNRGGYQCGHQIFPIISEGVPEEIRKKFADK